MTNWDWVGAEQEFRRAIELNPNYDRAHHWYAGFLKITGRWPEALTEMKRALELNPTYLIVNTNLGVYYYECEGRFDKAEEQFQKTIDLNPG